MEKVFNISDSTMIYVVCPANVKTGGTELLHQLVFELNSLNKKARIVYYLEGKASKQYPTPEEFKKYITDFDFINDVDDSQNNLIVFPEVCIGKQKKFKKIQKCVWWLSVDNFLSMCGRIERLKKYGFNSFAKHIFLNDYVTNNDITSIPVHLYQSYYAADFLKNKGIEENQLFYLSDYINDVYIEEKSDIEKEDIVIYNPKKGLEFTKKLIDYDKSIKWVPIENMTNKEVQNLMHRAKVYIDFGNHPGKDRIPREAALSDCCVITNKRGAANFAEDNPIMDKYKFEEDDSQIPNIVKAIKECIKNYDQVVPEFYNYINIIKEEKKEFISCIVNIFD